MRAAWLLLLLPLVSCATEGANQPAPLEAESVKPGINDRWLDPEFTVDELHKALSAFKGRTRRFGGVV